MEKNGASEEEIKQTVKDMGEGKLFSKVDELTAREDGYKIADDNETIELVKIPKDKVPNFKKISDLRKWLIGEFENIGNITIDSTGANADFNKTAAEKVIKNARQRRNNIAYPEIEKVVKGAKYSGFREADDRHKDKVRGQDVYHTGVVYNGKPFRVEFYVDVPLTTGGDNYAGQNIREIRIEPSGTQVSSENQNRQASQQDSTLTVSLAVLRGKVNPAREKNGIRQLIREQCLFVRKFLCR